MEIRTIVRFVIFLIPIIFFLNIFIWGDNGILSYMRLIREVVIEKQNIEALRGELDLLRKEVSNFEKDNFYLEKVAREDLLMGEEGELVYLIK